MMRSFLLRGVVAGTVILFASFPTVAEDKPKPPRVRSFQFTYAAKIMALKPGQTARIWLPVPSSNEEQEVKIVAKDLPGKVQIQRAKSHSNRMLYLEAKANEKGVIPLRIVYAVKRRELTREKAVMGEEDAEQLSRLLEANRRVPITGKSLELLRGKQVPSNEMEAARFFYDLVNKHMHYSKEGAGWGNGDSVWACEKGRGNCTDFHSLFISLARARRIPAQFVIGFLLPTQRGRGDVPGYHCWAKFHLSAGSWLPVDISEANKEPHLSDYYFGNLTADRVAFSSGRDLVLVPRQAGPPINYFIYPYVEIDGKEHPQEKIERRFSYRDQ